MLKPHHYQELEKSAIVPEIIELNFKSLSGNDAYEHLLYGLPDTERRNDGRLRDNWLRRYGHLDYGGWWCGTIDPLTAQESDWGCFKPNNPRIDPEKRKPIKYENPPKVPTEAFFLKVTWEIGLKIAERYGCGEAFREAFPVKGAINIWEFVRVHPQISLIITEGVKKTASLLSAGYCAIGLVGIWNGYRQERDDYQNAIGLPYLIPQLVPFATPYREISFCFDNDDKPKTKQAVRQATLKTGNQFKFKGCQVSVVTWDAQEKGVDDLIAAFGTEYFDEVYESRISLDDYKLGEVLDLSPYVNLTINERYLPDGLVPSVTAQLIGIKSVQGTGKTEWLARKIEPMLSRGEKVIVIVHREQLAITLANRFGIDYRTEIYKSETKGIFGYALCIDSLHPKANPKFNPQDWEGATVILDEVEQVLWHLLAGDTCQNQRVSILKTFKELLNVVVSTGGKIYLADADLSPISIKYIKSLIDQRVETWVVENVYKPKKRKLYYYDYEDAGSLIKKACDYIENEQKILIHTDGQKHKSAHGTRNLEYYLKGQFPDKRILRIDRESVSDPKHPAYGCMGNLDDILKDYDVAIASPVLETGVSIDIKNHFSAVFLLSHAVQTVDGVSQALERLRDGVDRHIWVKDFSPNRIGNGSIDIRSLLAGEHQKSKFNQSQLVKAGYTETAFIEDDLAVSPSLLAWAKRACVINSQAANFKESLLKKLGDRYEIIEAQDNRDAGRSKEIKEARDVLYDSHCQFVSMAQTPSSKELKELKEKRSKTEDERLKERKGILTQRYITENIDKELVKKDDDGYYQKWRLHYFLTVARDQVAERDHKKLEKFKEFDSQAFKPDYNNSILSGKITALEMLDIKQFFNSSKEFSIDSLKEWYERINTTTRSQIKCLLGVWISEKDSPIAAAQRLLRLLGLRLEFVRQERDGTRRIRIYKGCDLDPDGRQEIFRRWLSSEHQEMAS